MEKEKGSSERPSHIRVQGEDPDRYQSFCRTQILASAHTFRLRARTEARRVLFLQSPRVEVRSAVDLPVRRRMSDDRSHTGLQGARG